MAIQHVLNLFGDRLRTLPILVLYLTDGCNSRCATCDIWRSPRRNMRPELIDSLVDDAAKLNVRWVVLSGGEATQHPEWAGIAAKFRRIGARVILLTNGLLIRRQAEAVISAVDELVVSLDGGTAATYEAIRGVDAFDLVLDGMAAVRRGGIPVITRTTVQRANFREIPQIIDAAKRADTSHISFLTVDVSNPFAFGPRFTADASLPITASMGSSIDTGALIGHDPPPSALTLDECDELSLILDRIEPEYAADFASGRISESPAKLRRMVDYFRAILGEGTYPAVRCNAPHTSVVVEVDGTIRPCYFLPSVGRVRPGNGSSLIPALNADPAVALRKAYRMGERPECAACVCPLHKGGRALLQL